MQRDAVGRVLLRDLRHRRAELHGIGRREVVLDQAVLVRDAERVEKGTHHRPLLGEVIEDERARRKTVGQ